MIHPHQKNMNPQEKLLSHYEVSARKLTRLYLQYVESRVRFFQHILLLSSSLLAILVSLHTVQEQLYSQMVFLAVVFLLSLAVLLGCITLYDHVKHYGAVAEAQYKELLEALEQKREMNQFFVREKKRTKLLEKMSYVFFFAAVGLLPVYALLFSF